jgi:hypothetical protein
MSGKGSKQRPTDKKKFDDNYDRIFGNKKKDEFLDEIRRPNEKTKRI